MFWFFSFFLKKSSMWWACDHLSMKVNIIRYLMVWLDMAVTGLNDVLGWSSSPFSIVCELKCAVLCHVKLGLDSLMGKMFLPWDGVKSLLKGLGKIMISLWKFDRHLGSGAAEVPVKFESDQIFQSSCLVALVFCKIWWQDLLMFSE